jgi:hypothetical protein
MKYLLYFFLITLIQSCTSSKKTFWCGDHPCANKVEQKLFFEKNLSVEVKKKYIVQKKEISKVSNIVEQASKEDRKNAKQVAKLEKLERKRILKEEKELIKLSKIENKKKAKWKTKEKSKKVLEEYKLNDSIEIKKNLKKKELIVENISKNELLNNDFEKIAEILKKRNKLKSYPNINDIKK